MLQALPLLTRFWAWLPSTIFFLSLCIQGQATLHNVSISNAAPQIVYTPSLCDTSSVDNNGQCNGAWNVIQYNGTSFVSTTGPAPASAGIIPQMFLQFRASALYIMTSPLSNAAANISVSNNGEIAIATFNTSLGAASILNLQESTLSTVSLTFIPSKFPTRLDIGSIILTVTGNPEPSSILPTMTLPPTASLPSTFGTPSSTTLSTSTTTESSHKQLIKLALGITLGLSLGLTAVAVVIYILWHRTRRRRRKRTPSLETGGSEKTGSVSRSYPSWSQLASPTSPIAFAPPTPSAKPPATRNSTSVMMGTGRMPPIMGQSSKISRFFGT